MKYIDRFLSFRRLEAIASFIHLISVTPKAGKSLYGDWGHIMIPRTAQQSRTQLAWVVKKKDTVYSMHHIIKDRFT